MAGAEPTSNPASVLGDRRPGPLIALGVTAALLFGGAIVAADDDDPSPPAAVHDGRARFQVLSPTLIRMEYAPDGRFEDRPTFNAVNRDLPVPAYTSDIEHGERVIRTDRLTLRYKLNSGPFSDGNVTVEPRDSAPAHPVWRLAGDCDYGVACEAELTRLSGGAGLADDQRGFTGPGFVDGMQGTVAWSAAHVPAAGMHRVGFRYANGGDGTQTALITAGDTKVRLDLPPTGGWDDWAETAAVMELPAGSSGVSVGCADAAAKRCAFNVDSVAVTATGAAYPAMADAAHSAANLGGWRRSLDYADGPRPLYDGLLSRDGWFLLNDSATALATGQPRTVQDTYQDGYLFGYGQDYRRALQDLRDLTGPAVTLPRWAFGTWFSRYYPYKDADYRDDILPAFRENDVPLDVLVVDTDFKSPGFWNGWDWNPALFPDPKGFLDWATGEGLRVALNIHPSIRADDPHYAEVVETVGHELPVGACEAGNPCRVFDFSDPVELRAYFDLHRPFDALAPIVWWPDSCCDSSVATTPGISPDSWLNAQYAAYIDGQGRRGFSWNRSGSGFTAYAESAVYPAGPWADHRYTVDTSMDTTSTWELLAFASRYTVLRGAIGMPYESHDIGGHNYPRDGNRLPPDLYARWVQFGAFQPLLRLHSNHGFRLPWDYPQQARDSAAKFLRLREALIPYTYTLARQARDTGLPMARGMFLNYPAFQEAYDFTSQYLFGDDLLVAPVTGAGTDGVRTDVWFPPGTWTDWFTGRSYTGPKVETVTTDLGTMPVFQRAGGILPTRTDDVPNASASPMDKVTLDVATGANGEFRLYEDAGEGHGDRAGELAWTTIRYDGAVIIEARDGAFPGAVDKRAWTVRLRAVAAKPARVLLNGAELDDGAWSFDAGTRTVTIRTPPLPTGVEQRISVA
ncbi:TIM-barrel domain-containing protein [Dactylosporangium sp. NPDC005555]|uniref:TIM-barrel domain-containing protein n=1 Tax=Dactylosporangium sp. NPDC005555 TaxID=3154889 RepID=UPI0033BBC3D7